MLVRDISFNSMCEHHLLPFMGVAHVGYIPDGKVIGLSKLARVVEVVSKRPQVQERMTEQIANLLVEELECERGGGGGRSDAYVYDDSRHSQARKPVRHFGHEGHLPLEPFQPLGSDDADLWRTSKLSGRFLMPLLTEFIFRLAFGLALAMALVSARQVTSGYFRNHLYVLLGLDVLATLIALADREHYAIWPPAGWGRCQLSRRRGVVVREASGWTAGAVRGRGGESLRFIARHADKRARAIWRLR